MKLRVVLIMLLVALSAQAQSVTEKDLLGTWHVKTVSLNGCGIDFEYDSVFLSDEIKKEMDAGQLAVYTEQLYQGLSRYHDMAVTFTPEGIIEVIIDGNTMSHSYTVTNKDGVAYLGDDKSQDTIITLPGGDMQWQNSTEKYDMMMLFKKQ